MKRAIATLSMFSVILLAAGSPLAGASDEKKPDQPECAQEARVVGASCPPPRTRRDTVEKPDADEQNVEIPIYVPPTRGSTLVGAHNTRGAHGARRPGQRL